MTSLEVAAFQEVWSKNCNLRIGQQLVSPPCLGQQEAGVFKRFCKKLLKYE